MSYSANILIVAEDFSTQLELMENLLNRPDWNTEAASTLDEALRMLDQSEFNFALLDPKLNQNSARPFLDKAMKTGVPVIFCTDRQLDETRNGFAEAIDFFGQTCLQGVNALFKQASQIRKSIPVSDDTLKPS